MVWCVCALKKTSNFVLTDMSGPSHGWMSTIQLYSSENFLHILGCSVRFQNLRQKSERT